MIADAGELDCRARHPGRLVPTSGVASAVPRIANLRSSVAHSTRLAIAAHTNHWSIVSGTVPNAILRTGTLTTATCSSSDTPMALHNHGFTKKPRNALVSSERAARQ